jgi:hypothetical protein
MAPDPGACKNIAQMSLLWRQRTVKQVSAIMTQ